MNRRASRRGSAAQTAVTLLMLGVGSAVFGAFVVGPRLTDQLQAKEQRSSAAEQALASRGTSDEPPRFPDPAVDVREKQPEPRSSDEDDDTVKVDVRDVANPNGEDPAPLGGGAGESDAGQLVPASAPGRRDEDSPGTEQEEPRRETRAERKREERDETSRRDREDEDRPRRREREAREEPRREESQRDESRRDEPRAEEPRRNRRPGRDEREEPKREETTNRSDRRRDEEPRRDRPSREERPKETERPSTLKLAMEAAARAERGEPEKRETKKSEPRKSEPERAVVKPVAAEKPKAAATSTPEKEEAEVFTVRVGRFKSKEAAQKFQEAVTAAAGEGGSVIEVPGGYRLQMGVYRNRVNAEKLADRLKEHDLNAEITPETRRVPK